MALSSKTEGERAVLAFPASARPALPPPAPAAAGDEPGADAARAEVIDRLLHAWQGRLTASLSPAALLLPLADWAIHLANAAGKQAALIEKALRKSTRFGLYLAHAAANKVAKSWIFRYKLRGNAREMGLGAGSPIEFLTRNWRATTGGTFGMGLRHGAYCVGCWALMLLLFAGGVMNLLWIAGLSVVSSSKR